MLNKSVRDKIAVGLGSSLDWYDFALYGFFAKLFSKLFFPPEMDSDYSLLLSYLTWFAGFAARPIGVLLIGHMGDKFGRAYCLSFTSRIILIPVLILPILPTYSLIGIWAPISLLILRIVQGVCIGGEFAGSIIYLCETAPKTKNYFFGSLGSCTY